METTPTSVNIMRSFSFYEDVSEPDDFYVSFFEVSLSLASFSMYFSVFSSLSLVSMIFLIFKFLFFVLLGFHQQPVALEAAQPAVLPLFCGSCVVPDRLLFLPRALRAAKPGVPLSKDPDIL